MNPRLISVIIVNYNGAEFIDDCIKSIFKQTYKNYEIIILDNNSKDDSVEIIRKYPEIHLIESEENLGFAKGNNKAIQYSRGEYIALINNDATADSNWLQRLSDVLDRNELLGSCASKIISYYDQRILDSTGLLIHKNGMSRGRGRNKEVSNFNQSEAILIPSGCASMYRKRALDQVGLFDEDFFCYCEDTDLGLRLQLAGWKCNYVSDALVYHRYSETAGKYSSFKTYLVERNHYWVVIKNFPLRLVLLNPIYTIQLYLYQVSLLLKGESATGELINNVPKKQLILTLLRAHRDTWLGMAKMFRKRLVISKTKKVKAREFNRLIKDHQISLDELFHL